MITKIDGEWFDVAEWRWRDDGRSWDAERNAAAWYNDKMTELSKLDNVVVDFDKSSIDYVKANSGHRHDKWIRARVIYKNQNSKYPEDDPVDRKIEDLKKEIEMRKNGESLYANKYAAEHRKAEDLNYELDCLKKRHAREIRTRKTFCIGVVAVAVGVCVITMICAKNLIDRVRGDVSVQYDKLVAPQERQQQGVPVRYASNGSELGRDQAWRVFTLRSRVKDISCP